MKKIMFSDAYSLTKAVLRGLKTKTRRIIPKSFFSLNWDVREDTLVYENDFGDFIDIRQSAFARYKVGEVVAVAQNYKSVTEYLAKKSYDVAKWMDDNHITKDVAGWLNKMFVKAELMIFKIRITNVRVERLQDISDEDCIKEGIKYDQYDLEYDTGDMFDYSGNDGDAFDTPREAYAALIDKISGKGTWKSNPFVFAYEFELIK